MTIKHDEPIYRRLLNPTTDQSPDKDETGWEEFRREPVRALVRKCDDLIQRYAKKHPLEAQRWTRKR